MNLVILFLQIVVLILTIIIAKLSNSNTTVYDSIKKLEIVEYYAKAFVRWADEFRSNSSGSDKMKAVINQLIPICEKYNITYTTLDELKAIIQKAYDEYKDNSKLPEVIPVITETAEGTDGETVAMILDDDIKLVK